MQANRRFLRVGLTLVGATLLAQPAAAHVGSLGGLMTPVAVPTWLTILTGGIIVGVSFMFTSLLTDHAAIRAINGWRLLLSPPTSVRQALRITVQGLSVGVLVVVVTAGLIGPQTPTSNFAILFVWAGWWAGYTMSVYLFGNTWEWCNPWRALVAPVPRNGYRSYPERLGGWPSVVALLGLVWLEVISPVASDPQLLAAVIIGYSVVTLTGAVVFGPDAWFEQVDPIARVFRCYGRIAPLQRTETGVAFKLPTAALAARGDNLEADDTAFIIALLWVTTYDGFISTPLWGTLLRPLVAVGVPPLAVYFGTIVAGFTLFLSVFRLAARRSRRSGRTYITPRFIEGWFAPALLPIAAGYHLAHFLGFYITLSPALQTVALQPFSQPADVLVLILPAWFSLVQLGFVLFGHLLAVWTAHALAFDLFPGKLKPIRSQYPFVVVMIFYTMTSLWILTQPFTTPPYV